MFDKKLMLLDPSADVTATGTGTGVDFHGEDHYDLEYRIVIPKAAANTTLTVKIQESDDNDTYTDLIIMPAYSTAKVAHFHARSKKRYRRAIWTVGGTGASNADFGKVKIGVVPAGTHRDW